MNEEELRAAAAKLSRLTKEKSALSVKVPTLRKRVFLGCMHSAAER